LFEANAVMSFPAMSEEENFLRGQIVIPRIGTISPWSSKATDIIHNCGLMDVVRAERGILYECRFAAALNDAQQAVFEKLIHDRMMEEVVSDFSQLPQLFAQQDPKPFKTIDLLG